MRRRDVSSNKEEEKHDLLIFGRANFCWYLSQSTQALLFCYPSLIQLKRMQDIQVKVKVNSQIEVGELIAAVPISTKMNQDQTTTEAPKTEVAPIVFQPPPITEELVKEKEKESGEPAPTLSHNDTNKNLGEAPASKKQKKVNDDTNKLVPKGGVTEGQGCPAKAKSSFVPPPFNPGLGLGYSSSGLLHPMAYPSNQYHPSFNHHMYGSYPWKAIHRSGGVSGAYPMYHPQTSSAGVAHSTPMYGQAIIQSVSTDSSTDANNNNANQVEMLKQLKDEIKGMKGMITHLLIQNKELIKQNAELIEKIKN